MVSSNIMYLDRAYAGGITSIFIIYNSINQDPDVMKKMAVLIIVIESLSFLYLLLTNNIS